MQFDNPSHLKQAVLVTVVFLSGLIGSVPFLHAQNQSVKIRLEDEQHQPVTDAKVWVVTTNLGGPQQEPAELSNGTTGADGRAIVKFTDLWISTPAAFRQEAAFVAYRPGYGVTSLAIWRDSPLRESELVLTMPRSTSTTIQVRTPDNQPLTKGTVSVTSLAADTLHTSYDEKTAAQYAASRGQKVKKYSWGYTGGQTPILLPGELQKKLTFNLDDQGQVKIPDLEAKNIAIVSIESSAFGTQSHFRNLYLHNAKEPRNESWPSLVMLSPVGKFTAKVTTTPPGMAIHRKFTISTRPSHLALQSQDLIVLGSVEVQPNADGLIEIPAIATGELNWQLVPVPDEKLVVESPPQMGGPKVNPGKTTNAEIKVSAGIRFKGTVLDSSTDKPISDAVVIGFSGMQYRTTQTDKEGRYQFLTSAGQAGVHVGPPLGYFPIARKPGSMQGGFEIPANQTEFKAPPIKLDPAVTCTGIAVDEQTKPIKGATIHISWMGRNRLSENASWSQSTIQTNELGEFEIKGIDPGECWIWGEYNGAFSDKAIAVTSKEFQGLKLTISPNNVVIYKGKLIDSEGHAVQQAAVEISSRSPGDPSNVAVDVPVNPDSIKFMPDGTFQLPPLAPHNAYAFTIKASSCLPLKLLWSPPKGSGSQDLGEIVLKLVGNITGTVVDREGEPVPNAKVISITAKERRESTTGPNGAFRFDDSVKDGFLIVDHPDFRCTGRSLDQLKEGVRIAVIRHSESLPEQYQPRAVGLSAEAQRQLADQLLEPLLNPKSKTTSQLLLRTLSAKASWDPLGALEVLESGIVKESDYADMVRRQIVNSLAKNDVDAALEVTESIKEDSARAMSLRTLAESAKLPLEKKKQLLADGYVRVKAMKQPELRLCFQAMIAESLWEIGEKQKSEELLREGLELARKLPVSEFGGYARGCFAEELAVSDLSAALDLIKNLQDSGEFERHHGNIAHELANRNSAEAQRVLGMLKPVDPNGNRFDGKSTYAIPVCYRMASVDLPRAMEIAGSLKDEYARALCYGIMAEALVAKDRAASSDLIEKAFQALQSRSGKPRDRLSSQYTAGEVAGSLLPTIEKLDSQRIPESIWRCLALLEPIVSDPQNLFWTTEDKCRLALFVGLYDVSIGKTLVNWVDNLPPMYGYESGTMLPAMTVVDPKAAVAKIQANTNANRADQERISTAKILAHQGEARIRVLRRSAGLWNIDVEDFDAD
ncbi:MAG: hypothetical protein JWM11_3725 [Planctomycetaceae bacterium]|nr:hypothetical protein [Planctomycetaceae bacterium]